MIARILLILTLVATLGAAGAQNGEPAPAPTDPRVSALDWFRAQARAGDAEGDALLVKMDEAVGWLERTIPANRQQEAAFRAEIEGAPAQIAQFRADLERAEPPPEWLPPTIAPGLSLEDRIDALDQGLRVLTERADTVRKRIETINQQRAERSARQTVIPDELALARARLDEIEDDLAALPPGPSVEEIAANPDAAAQDATALTRLLLDAEREHLQALVSRLIAERERLLAIAPRAELRLRVAEREVGALDQSIAAVGADLARERERAAAERERQERERLSALPPELEELSARVLALLEENTARAARLSEAQSMLGDVRDRIEYVRSRKAEVVERVRVARSGTDVGPVLRRVQSTLPSPGDIRGAVRRVMREEATLQGRVYDLQDAIDRLPARTGEAARGYLTTALGAADPSDELVRETADLLERERAALGALIETINGDDRLIETLQELSVRKQELEIAVSELNDFISAQILWVRSDPALGASQTRAALNGLWKLVDARQWASLTRDAARHVTDSPALVALFAGAFALLGVARVWESRQLRVVQGLASKPSTDRLSRTYVALALVALRAATIPAALWLLGRFAANAADPTMLSTRLMSQGLTVGAASLWVGLFIIGLCEPRGVGETHFRWKSGATRSTRRNLAWYVPLYTTLVAMLVVCWPSDDDHELRSLARLALGVATLATAALVAVWLRPAGPVMTSMLERAQWRGWRTLWPEMYAALVLAPLALTVMNAVGWAFTAESLFRQLQGTAVIVMSILLVRAVVIRWLLLVRRRVAVEQHRKRIEAAKAAAAAAASAEDAGAPTDVPKPEDPPEIDLSSVDQQTRSFVALAAWVTGVAVILPVWASVFPALGLLENVHLIATETYRLSVRDVIVALVIGVLGTLAVRTAPNVLGGFILPRTGLDAGSQYAIVTLARYGLFAVAAFMFCGALRVNWSSLGWILAGASVGLGFGMQQIFANFVSGIILLFERPVRPGDMVRIGDQGGIVKQIRIRATVVQDWECRDVIVPNRNLIEQTIFNQTRSDRSARVLIVVGVAYGSDTVLAERLLRETCEAHDEVIAARVTFDAFGDNALNFTVRLTIRDVDKRLDVTNELHQRVYLRLRENGVEIAFPQRDLHLRDGELTVNVRTAPDGASSEPRA